MEYDDFTGKTSDPLLLDEFPAPLELKMRYEKGVGISLDSENAKPLLVPYRGGEARQMMGRGSRIHLPTNNYK